MITVMRRYRRLLQVGLLLVIFLKPFSNLFLAWGMKQMPQVLSLNPLLYLKAMLEPLVAVGIVMQILWLLFRMKLLSLVFIAGGVAGMAMRRGPAVVARAAAADQP